jgi:hypothetical protein
LKHQWLYLNALDSVATVKKLVAFYVEQHNSQLPHSAFHGQTSDEMYFGTGTEVPQKLQASRISTRKARFKVNRASRSSNCSEPVDIRK